jgi:hypothetical protein
MTETRTLERYTDPDGKKQIRSIVTRQKHSHSIELYNDSQRVETFALFGSKGARVTIDVSQANVFEPGTSDKFYHQERRDGCDSSYYTLRNPSNPGFEFYVDRALPKPYKKAWFELEEKWTDLTCGNGRLTVYGVATKENGVISIGAINTCLGKRIIVTDWSIRTHDRAGIGCSIFCFLLVLITSPMGLAFLL